MTKRMSGWAVAMMLTACGGSSATSATTATSSEAAPAFAQISVADVAAAIQAPERHVAVFDANHRDRYDAAHVPGATWVDYDGVTREQLPADASTPLVFYCFNEQCSASHVAAEQAIALGFADVSVMGGGIEGWVAAGLPTEGSGAPETATP